MTYTTQEKIDLLSQLILMALADNKLSPEELEFLKKIAQRMDIEESELMSMIRYRDELTVSTPQSHTKRIIHFHKLLLMMHIDGKVNDGELQLLHEVALKYGFRKSVVDSLLNAMKNYPHGEIPPSELLTIHSSQNN
ncbi:hypothetical protein BST97_06790 [Nonlabens spongiae]|uniref:Uncharacterized protein n=1 Tax=Nonlabens spongiae TaxID=331648 RepID=A0A1W6MJP2_9FLAO|nr:TerB family tellurite resistance protein [Nonlabens spongiae]ARN77726.1 hypothetical protein BST97_06790 [Nonlabens spongiae]